MKTVFFIHFNPNPQSTTNGQTNKKKVLCIGNTQIVELNVFHPEVLSKVILGYYM